MKKVTLFLGVAALISSCSTSIPMATSYSYSEYQTVSPSQSVYTAPVIADLNVAEERITYAERINKNITTLTDAEVEALAFREKEVVIANAAIKYQADEIVAPIFIITPNANKTEVEVKVTGYVGKYKNFRKATEKDINFLNTYNGAK
jgi:hypothetical protein